MAMTTVNIRKLGTETRHPLYQYYHGQDQPQPAYLEIDLESGVVEADCSGEIGTAVPVRVWHGVVQRYGINNDLTYIEINELMDKIAPLAQRVIDGAEVGYNRQANLTASFSDDAQLAIESIEDACEGVETTSGGVWTANDLFQNFSAQETLDITATTTDDELEKIIAEEVKSVEEHYDCTVVGLADYLTQVRDDLVAEEQ